jgi:hypothetical protein
LKRRGTHAYSKRPKANETKKKNNGERERTREKIMENSPNNL